jgi:hypothetical protein
LNSLYLAGEVRLLPANAGPSRLNILTIAGSTNNWTGQLDLTSNALILQTAGGANKSAALAAVQNQILSGRAGGTWQGRGITSATVAGDTVNLGLALADNGDLGYTSFRGQPVDTNSLIITQALLGDATLDNKVDAFDLNKVAASWQQSGKLWSGGDFTGDGVVNAFDLNLLAAHWQASISGSLQAALSALPIAVPEPATLACFLAGLPVLTIRRRATARGTR